MYSMIASRSIRGNADTQHPRISMASSYQQHEIRDSHEMANSLLRQNDEDGGVARDEMQHTVPHPDFGAKLGTGGLCGGGMIRAKSVFSMESSVNLSLSKGSSCSSIESSEASAKYKQEPGTPLLPSLELDFIPEMRRFTGSNPSPPDFSNSSLLRKVMEPHLRRARLMREASRSTTHLKVAASIASSMGVPYTALRRESRFLYDQDTHPLHTLLADALQVENLSQVHHVLAAAAADNKSLLLPLLDENNRLAFHSAYDTFVTSFCIPLLHSMALTKGVLQHSTASDRITYRYQAFPTIQISRPGGSALQAPTCDSALGHSVGCLTFFIPLTPCEGTNCLYIESHPGKEDWHPLSAKSVGLGYLIDGTRCLHFDLENTTDTSRVSLMFRVMIYRDDDDNDSAGLCPQALLVDDFTTTNSDRNGYYDEAFVDLRRADAVVKKYGNRLLYPSPRVGHPFA